jgi:DNA end-binding protein Ku
MARAIWSGAISFGLVNVPVKLYSATSPKTVRFHQLSSKTGARIRQKRVDPSTGEEVPYEEIVKGYELTPDRYVLISPEELDALDPKATKTIDIEEFVDLAEIDPIYYDHSYYLAPTAGGAKAYRLLLDAMSESGKVGIGRVVLRSKQQLCALRPTDGVLTLSTMLFGDEVLAPDRLDELDSITEAEATDRELRMAEQLIASLSAEFDPAKFRDEYRERVIELIERKASGEEIAVQPEAEEPAPAPDLMAALEASLAAVKADDSDVVPDAPAAAKEPAKPRKRASGAANGKAAKKPAKAKR